MPVRYTKTALGRGEIQSRSHALSRTARTLLLILDASRAGRAWVGLVQGATDADLQALLDAGLIEPAEGQDPVESGRAPAASLDPAPAHPAFASLSYSELNTRLNALVKTHLGLIKGYRFTLDIERAPDVIALQGVALRLVAEVDAARGAPAVAEVRRALGL